ncbi:hypothetical protein [Polaromonas sp.]|uniref:hypothetical protein n=1 Tax=Polaromonas sp. TaxID=1869339 RepID=UPI003459EFFE
MSQSDALVAVILDWARARAIGFSHVVSLGSQADVDLGDMLDYLGSDSRTRAIVVYIEAIESPRKFMSAARAAARNKPVIVVKSRRSPQGQQAAASHTGARAGSDMVYNPGNWSILIVRWRSSSPTAPSPKASARAFPSHCRCLTALEHSSDNTRSTLRRRHENRPRPRCRRQNPRAGNSHRQCRSGHR